MLKSKVWRLVKENSDLVNKKSIKHKLRLELEQEGLVNANTILRMAVRRIWRFKRLFLCQKQNLDRFLSKNGRASSKPILVPLVHQILMTSKEYSQGKVKNDSIIQGSCSHVVDNIMQGTTSRWSFSTYTFDMLNIFRFSPCMQHGIATKIVLKHVKDSFGVGLICIRLYKTINHTHQIIGRLKECKRKLFFYTKNFTLLKDNNSLQTLI